MNKNEDYYCKIKDHLIHLKNGLIQMDGILRLKCKLNSPGAEPEILNTYLRK